MQWLLDNPTSAGWSYVYQGLVKQNVKLTTEQHQALTQVSMQWLLDNPTNPVWSYVYKPFMEHHAALSADQQQALTQVSMQWLVDNPTHTGWNYVYQALMARRDLPDTIYQTLIAQGLQWLETYGDVAGWAYVLKALLQTSDRMRAEDQQKARDMGQFWLERTPSDQRRNEIAQALRQFVDFSTFQEGDIIRGKVVKLVKYGAFVSLGPVEGLLHNSNIAHHRVEHPGNVLSVGDEVTVRIEKVDRERKRLELNRRALLPNPFECYQVGDIISGTVADVVPYGIFVQIEEHLIEGLLHTNEMQSLGEGQPGAFFTKGDAVHQARIVRVDVAKRRLGLSLDALPEEEWQRRQQSAPADDTI
jgi:predicted RNA-binding protein with RPS1 domain